MKGVILVSLCIWKSVYELNYTLLFGVILFINTFYISGLGITDNTINKDKNYVVHEFTNGKMILIERVHGNYGIGLWVNQDHIMPDYGRLNGIDDEKEKHNYWKDYFENKLKDKIDLGLDSFRIDLAHGFGKIFGEERHTDYSLFKSLLEESLKYAKSKNKKVYFILETYDLGFIKPSIFRDWNIKFGLNYPAIKVYHKEIEENLLNIHNDGNLDKFIGNLGWLLQDIRGIYGEIMAISTFDDYLLIDIARKSGIDHKYILEIQLLLGKAGYNIFSLDRDFLGKSGEVIPSIPGGKRE